MVLTKILEVAVTQAATTARRNVHEDPPHIKHERASCRRHGT